MDGGLDGLNQQQTAWWFLQQMSVALGQRQILEDEPGSDAPGYAANNYAVSSESNSHATENQGIQFQSKADANGDYATLGIKGHYYEVAIYVAQVHCATPGRSWTDAEEQLNLLWHNSTGSNTVRVLPTDSSTGYNICTSGDSITLANSTPAHTAYLVSEPFQLQQDATLGLQLLNNQSDPTGNDVAFDLPQIIDVTPQLDKSFSPTVIAQGGVSQLTFTITNASGIAPAAPGTHDLAAKAGWSFTDTMPPGLTVAATPNIVTDCGSPNIAFNATRDTITVTNGSLAAGDPGYCTIKMDVTTNIPGTYVNGTSTGGPDNADGNNITSIFGLGAPGDATLRDAPPSLTLTKTASRDAVTDAGQVITYTFAVTNPSTVPITDLRVDETAFNGTGDSTELDAPTCLTTTLAPGASTTCTATYETTLSDINTLTTITNTAQASGVADGNSNPNRTLSNESTAVVNVVDGPHLMLRKAVSPTSGGTEGSLLTYTFTITNDGNESVHGIDIDETTFTGTGDMNALTCDNSETPGAISLDPEESINCTATYTVTKQDVYAGLVDNTAKATGLDPTDADVVSSPASAESLLDQASSIAVTKDHLTPPDPAKAGSTVKFTFTVTNTGDTALTNISVADSLAGLSTPVCPGTGQSWPGAFPNRLLPTQSVICDATYTLKQADLDAGQVVNPSAVASGVPTGQTQPVNSDPANDTIPLTAHPALTLVKSASPNTPAKFVAGQVITYTFTVKNTGNVTVSDLGITETDFDGSDSITGLVCPTTPLSPGATAKCTATYTLTDDDIAQGSITNTAVATGDDPSGGNVDSDPAEVTLPGEPQPGATADTGGSVLTSPVLPDGIAIGATLTGAAIIVLLALVWASANANSNPKKQPKRL